MKGRRYLYIAAGSGARGLGKKMVWPKGAKALARSIQSKLAPSLTPRQAHHVEKYSLPQLLIWKEQISIDTWFSSHTGYQTPGDRRRSTSGLENTGSSAARSTGRQLRHRGVRGQIATDTQVSGTQLNIDTQDGYIKRMFRAILCH